VGQLVLTEGEAAIYRAVGTKAFLRAREHLVRGEVADVRWDARSGRGHGRVRGERAGRVTASVSTSGDGAVAAVDGVCSCSVLPACAHPAAVVLAAMRDSGPGAGVPVGPAWEAALSGFSEPPATPQRPTPAAAGVGLQLDLVVADAPGTRPWITLRPVVPGRSGWVRSGINWQSLGYGWYGRPKADARHVGLLREILSLARAGEDGIWYGSGPQNVDLNNFPSRRIWDLLAEAQEMGLPLVQPGKASAPVVVARAPAQVSIRVDRAGEDLLLRPALLLDGIPAVPDCALLAGDPPHGVAAWGVLGEPVPAPKDRVLRLAPLERPLSPALRALLAEPEIVVPAADEDRFFQRYYPSLLRHAGVVAGTESVRLPDLGPAVLTLSVDRLAGHELSLAWDWVLPVGDDQHREPLGVPTPVGQADARDGVTGRAVELLAGSMPGLLEATPAGPRLAPTATVAGDAMIRFLTDVMPRLVDLDGVEVEACLDGPGPVYREAHEPPVMSFADAGADLDSGVEADPGADAAGIGSGRDGSPAGAPDWFDLAVQVTVGGEQVAFNDLFVALAQDQEYLILPSGTYFRLDREEFRQLRELIAESRALEDAPPGVLRVGRFQAGVWQELDELGEVRGQAAAWQASLRALVDVGAAVDHPVPQGLEATLRSYQRDGFRWLAAHYEHRFGGVLADDMGLGKTLQTLALICHVREQGLSVAPFLVVAPASVVYNWATEAERFAPDLAVRVIGQTVARRGVELAEAAEGADVVVTSYTLFRLEYDDYAGLEWAGLVLDEAQFVKNPASQGHRCAKRLPAPFKLAITGTPLENNLTELWALLSITAPGLFPRAERFADYYRTPIEKERDAERLAQLRRRIRPLMLRRRKAEVIADLPAKQEQVLELELNTRHRKVYQTYLQRERQKVLGLLGDLEKNRFEIVRSLTLLRQAALDVSLVDPKHHTVPATKLDALAEQVADLVAEGHRSLVFSQFTRFLEASRRRLENAGIRCAYLDGSTRDRRAVLAEFKTGTAPVFLISLKAGGFGLNLTEADYCILLDPWWNPATEAQAVDRVHRIGQVRNVMVYRLVAKDTIEQKVMALKARKAELFSSVLDGGDFESARLTAADIRGLLQ
jgi:superfamily II DNA or RNA helicase